MKIRFILALAAVLAASPLCAITGFVFGPDGAPLPNVAVSALRPSWPHEYASQPDTILGTSRTDARGAFSLDVAGRQVIDIRIRVNGFLPVDLMLSSDDHDVSIPLRAVSMRDGKVTADAKPVAGAKIVASNDHSAVIAVSDSNGVFHLPDPAEWARTVTVTHPDFAPLRGGTGSLDYALNPGSPVDGSVVDETGRPVNGAEVTFRQGVSTRTGVDGRFHFAHVPTVIDAVFATAPGGRAMAIESRSPVLKLQPARTISGVVRDHAKQPLNGVVVMLIGGGIASMTTDVSGSFSFASAPVEAVSLRTAEGGGLIVSTSPIEAGVASLRRDIEVSPAVRYEGRVVAPDGSARSGAAIISVFRTDKYEFADALGIASAPDGRFHFYSASFPSPGWRLIALSSAIPPASSEPIVDASKLVVITVPAIVAVSGIVVDKDKKSVAGVEMRPVLLARPPLPGQRTSIGAWQRTDEGGRFTLPIGRDPIVLNLSKAGYDSLIATVVPKEPVESVQLVMARAPALRGIVVDTQRKPVSNIPVTVGGVTVKTAADGSFRFEGLPPGRVSVRYGSERVLTFPAEVPNTALTLVLPGLKSVRGQVVDAVTGRAVEQFDVVESRNTVHSSGGGFEATLWEDAFRLTVTAPGYRQAQTPISQNPLIVRLESAPILSGTVLGLNGVPAFGLNVGVSPAGMKDVQLGASKTDENGVFEFTDLPTGVYDLKVEDQHGNQAALKGVNVAKTHDVKLRLQKPDRAVIIGTVSGIQDVKPAVALRNEEWWQNVYPDASGNYRVEVPPGHVVLQLEVTEGGQSRIGRAVAVDVATGSETRVDLALTATVRVTGTISGRGGAHRFSLIFNGGQTPASAIADEKGAYTIDVAPGSYDVIISDQGDHEIRRVLERSIAIKEATTLDFAVEQHPIAVRVLNFDGGTPVANAAVMTTRPGETMPWMRVFTAADGTAVVNAPDRTPMNVGVSKEGYSGTFKELSGDESEVEFRIRDKAGVIVHLVDARDSHGLSGYISARQIDGPNAFFSRLGDEEGVALPLPPGNYRISASADGYGSESINVQVPSAEVRIPLLPGGSLVVLAPASVCGLYARLLMPNGEEYVPCWCNGIRKIRIECPQTEVDHITPGSYVLEIIPVTGDKRRFPVTVVEGQVATIAIP